MQPTRLDQRLVKRASTTALAVVAVAVLLTGCLTAEQDRELQLINTSRNSASKASLTVDLAASSKAQAWSERMAATGVLEHTGGGSRIDTGGLSSWCSVGENVGKGPSLSDVHTALMASSSHKANILGNFHRVGTGVYKKGNVYWVTQIFLKNC